MLATYIIFVHWLHINEQICKPKGYNIDLLHFIHDLDLKGSVGEDARDAMPGVCSALFILYITLGASPLFTEDGGIDVLTFSIRFWRCICCQEYSSLHSKV